MAFKKVGGARKYFKYNECKKGQVLVESGVYVGVEEGTYGPQYVFRTEDGGQTVLNSAGKLKHLLEKYAEPGDVCRVTYVGMATIPKGKFKDKDAHDFELEVDEDLKQAPPKINVDKVLSKEIEAELDLTL